MKNLGIGLAVSILLGLSALFLSITDLTPSPVTAAQAEEQAAPAPATPDAGVVDALRPKVNAEDLLAPADDDTSVGELASYIEDRSIGDDKAPVTIIEYASLTCPHCAHFEMKILPEIKKQLIDTGKVRFIYRDFPLDQFALKASMMARCLPAGQYFDMIQVIFNNQERWAHADDPLAGLAQLGSLAGMDAAAFKACTSNDALEKAIAKGVQQAQDKYDIKSTPTFVFNDGAEKLSGAYPVDKFEEIVNKLTKGK